MKYNKKNMKICEILGAKQFQKIVFILEKIKFNIIEKFFPNILSWYEKYNRKCLNKKLAKCDETKKKEIINEYRYRELLFKKEIIYKQNQNYHIDLENPTLFIDYLKFNRQVHVNGIKCNLIYIIEVILLRILAPNVLPMLINFVLVCNIIGFIVNFQCINLQNYNLCRFENQKMKNTLIKQEKKIKQEKTEKYGEGMNVIGRAFQENEHIPSIDEILARIETNEEKKQLLLYFKNQLKILKKENNESFLTFRERCNRK